MNNDIRDLGQCPWIDSGRITSNSEVIHWNKSKLLGEESESLT